MDTYVKNYGVISDSAAVQTACIQQAIDDCWNSGGGTVYFEPGLYRTGTVYLRSNTYLYFRLRVC